MRCGRAAAVIDGWGGGDGGTRPSATPVGTMPGGGGGEPPTVPAWGG